MSTNDELKVFDRFLIESEQEGGPDDNEDNEDEVFLVLPVEEFGKVKSEDGDEGDGNEVNGGCSSSMLPQAPFVFKDKHYGVDLLLLTGCTEPIHFYELFMTDIWDMVVKETNRYAEQNQKRWEPTDVEEMKRFIGLCLQMGIVRLPQLRDYWSSSPAFGKYPIGTDVMPRDRFEKLLSNLHFTDNETFDGQDKLYKISPLIQLVNRNSKAVYRPGKNVYVDEHHVPYRGRTSFRQHVPHKRQKYGFKLFKLCTNGGYTYRIIVCAGKEGSCDSGLDESKMIRLMDDLLDEGRHVYTNNGNTSITLADSLLQRKTYLITTCRKNKKGLPKQLMQQKLKREQPKAQQRVMLKLEDKSDTVRVYNTDTTHTHSMNSSQLIENYDMVPLFEDNNGIVKISTTPETTYCTNSTTLQQMENYTLVPMFEDKNDIVMMSTTPGTILSANSSSTPQLMENCTAVPMFEDKNDVVKMTTMISPETTYCTNSSTSQLMEGYTVLPTLDDKSDVVAMSTTSDTTLSTNLNSRPQQLAESNNQGKLFMCKIDQFYSPYVRRTSKWYTRLFFHLITQTCLVNAWRIYCENVQKISMTEFTIQVYLCLIPLDRLPTSSISHILEEVPKKWRRCVGCYRKLARCHDSVSAGIRTKQVSTKCVQCNKYFCLDCFNSSHNKM